MKRRSYFLGFLLLMAPMLVVPMLMAQSGSKLDEFTISGDAAKAALTTMEISVEAAEKLAKAAVAFASEQGHPVCVAIVGLGGNLVYAYRMNGMLPVNMDTAIYKAESACTSDSPPKLSRTATVLRLSISASCLRNI